MNSIWNKNIQSFCNRFPSLYEFYKPIITQITNSKKDTLEDLCELFPFYNFLYAKNGEITAETIFNNKKMMLHSSYNPSAEAQKAFTNSTQKEQIIFLGFGLAYHVQKVSKLILQSSLYKKLILIEENPLYFFASLCVVDWTEIFKIENLVLAINCPIEQLTSLIETTTHINLGNEGLSNSNIFTLPSFSLHSELYTKNVNELIKRNQTKNKINSATYKKFNKLWTNNSIKNIPYIKTLPFVNNLKNSKFSSDFLLVAAGPSLQNILPYLQELKKSLIIVCVETALRFVLQAGIEPDFIIITDPQYWAYRHIAGLSSLSSYLILPLSVHPATFRFNCKQIILCSEMFWISKFFEDKIESFGDLGAGGSVASSAWNFCYMMGAKNIYLAGLDLSFPTKQTHIKGSSSEQRLFSIANKMSSLDKMNFSSIYNANVQYDVSYEQKKVLTDSRMKMFAWWFESRLLSCTNVNTFSLCKESLQIKGVTYKDINQLIKELKPRTFNVNIEKKQINNFKSIMEAFNNELKLQRN